MEEANRLAEKIGLSGEMIFPSLQETATKQENLNTSLQFFYGGYCVRIYTGGIQSNHTLMTAAASCKFGFDVKLF